MRERAAELGGRVELTTSPCGGLAVEVRLPRATAMSE
jgi:signal transduction histidine kinase